MFCLLFKRVNTVVLVLFLHLSLMPVYLVLLSLLSLDSIIVPTTIFEVLSHEGRRMAMSDKMHALEHNQTWDLVPLPPG